MPDRSPRTMLHFSPKIQTCFLWKCQRWNITLEVSQGEWMRCLIADGSSCMVLCNGFIWMMIYHNWWDFYLTLSQVDGGPWRLRPLEESCGMHRMQIQEILPGYSLKISLLTYGSLQPRAFAWIDCTDSENNALVVTLVIVIPTLCDWDIPQVIITWPEIYLGWKYWRLEWPLRNLAECQFQSPLHCWSL